MLPTLCLFRTSYFFIFFLTSFFFFFLSFFLPRDPTKVAPLNGPRHIAIGRFACRRRMFRMGIETRGIRMPPSQDHAADPRGRRENSGEKERARATMEHPLDNEHQLYILSQFAI